MKKGGYFSLIAACVLSGTFMLSGCNGDVSPSASSAPTVDYNEIDNQSTFMPKSYDYTFMWYPENLHTASANTINVQTGKYGFSMDRETGSFVTLGSFETPYTREEAKNQDNDVIESLPQVLDMKYLISADDYTTEVVTSEREYFEGEPFQSDAGGAFRVIDSGTYIQRADIYSLQYEEYIDFKARMEFSAISEYLVLTYELYNGKEAKEAEASVMMQLEDEYNIAEFSYDNKVLTLKNSDGAGYAFIFDNDEGKIEYRDGKVYVTKNVLNEAAEWGGFSFVIIPMSNVTNELIDEYFAAKQVQIELDHFAPRKSTQPEIAYNEQNLAWEMNTPSSSGNMNFAIEGNMNAYERSRVTITNPTEHDVLVLANFYKPYEYPYTTYSNSGMSPMLRDAETLEPVGIPVQLSRNRHNYPVIGVWSANWSHAYVYIRIPAGETVDYEYTTAYAKWGDSYTSSFSQLCLVGWGSNQWWISSSIGSFGEMFCFDPDPTQHGRSIICDSHGLLLGTQEEGYGKYEWSNGDGGSDFLVYYEKGKGSTSFYNRDFINALKIDYINYSPNISRITFTGYSSDRKIKAELGLTQTRVDDIGKMLFDFKYTFLEDVEYDRLAFFQLGADNYNDSGMTKLAYGNSDGVILETDMPKDDTSGYVGYHKTMEQQVEIPGESVWVSMHGYELLPGRSGAWPNKAMVIREYSANINGKEYTQPTLSFYQSNNGTPSIVTEIAPPKECDGFIAKGSTVEGTVEYMMPPADRDDYYGQSEIIRNMDESYFDSWEIVREYAVKGQISVDVTQGELLSTYPVAVKSTGMNESVAAEFTITNGMGYVPVTVTNLEGYKNWRLFIVNEDGSETMVDQSVSGNDYWQCNYDAYTGTYSMSFNVPHYGDSHQYRLKSIA